MDRKSSQPSLFSQMSESAEAPGAEPRQAERPGGQPPDLRGKTVYVMDAHSLIYQVFHALPEMSSPQGEPVGAVFGFARDVLFLLENKKPDYLFCAFDEPGKTFRHELFEQYKANRPEMPEELVPQIEWARRLIDALGIPALSAPSYEADDILATIARMTDHRGGHCVLVTADKDCRQLISDRVVLYNIRKDQVLDREALRAEWGISPEQVIDFQALVGDSSDNVPGVPLIGPKVAGQLLARYGSLEGIFEHLDEISGTKRKENLAANREQAWLSRRLVRLHRHVPLVIDWEAGRVGRFDLPRAEALLRRLGFRSLVERVAALAEAPVAESRPLAEYHVVDSPEALERFLSQLRRQKRICLDLETTHLWPRWAEIVGVAVAWSESEAWYLPLKAPAGQRHLDPRATLEALRPVLEDPRVEKVGQNLKYDMVVLRGAGIDLSGVAFDTMVASYLLDAGQRNHSLDELARRYLNYQPIKYSQLTGSGKKQKRIDEVPVLHVAEYAGEDVVLPLRLRPILAEGLSRCRLDPLFHQLELPLIEVLAELEYNGIKVDVDRLRELSRQFGQRMAEAEERIFQLAGHRFNIASPKQLQQVLFEQLKLPVTKKTPKGGPSTDAEVLEELAARHPLPAEILQYRQYAKLKGTYVDALPRMVHPKTGRVHASFHQAVAATGRLSSSDPNLQNIPVRTKEGREIRSAFVAGWDDWVLLSADYSQIELRVLAHFSGDQRLCEAFARDEDIHARVASQVYGVPLEEVSPEMRRKAKAVNFGVIYGQTAYGLAKQLRIDKQEAAEFIDAYFDGYPGIARFLERVLVECSKSGYVSTILGRRREIRGVRPTGSRQRNLAERTAINTVIQGSAADLIKQAMIAIHRRLRQERLPARMLLQIHDELIFEVAAAELDHLANLVREEMSGVQRLRVPLKVDIKAGRSWAEAAPW